jgi:hypothetical protein
MQCRSRALFFSMALVFAQPAAIAAFVDLGNGSIYDTARNVTWTQDVRFDEVDLYPTARMSGLIGVDVANSDGSIHTVTGTDIYQALTSAFRVGGTWWGAKAWAQTLTYADTSGWRLPTQSELVGVMSDPAYSGTFAHTAFGGFSYLVWTSSEPSPSSVIQIQTNTGDPPYFYTVLSIPKALDMSGSFIQVAWAVHDGNVSAIAEPATLTLYLAGLVALLGANRRARRTNSLIPWVLGIKP